MLLKPGNLHADDERLAKLVGKSNYQSIWSQLFEFIFIVPPPPGWEETQAFVTLSFFLRFVKFTPTNYSHFFIMNHLQRTLLVVKIENNYFIFEYYW